MRKTYETTKHDNYQAQQQTQIIDAASRGGDEDLRAGRRRGGARGGRG